MSLFGFGSGNKGGGGSSGGGSGKSGGYSGSQSRNNPVAGTSNRGAKNVNKSSGSTYSGTSHSKIKK